MEDPTASGASFGELSPEDTSTTVLLVLLWDLVSLLIRALEDTTRFSRSELRVAEEFEDLEGILGDIVSSLTRWLREDTTGAPLGVTWRAALALFELLTLSTSEWPLSPAAMPLPLKITESGNVRVELLAPMAFVVLDI